MKEAFIKVLSFCLDFAIVTQATSLTKSCKTVFEIFVAHLVEVSQTERVTLLEVSASVVVALGVHDDLLFLLLGDGLEAAAHAMEPRLELLYICGAGSDHMRLVVTSGAEDQN